jgi:hypothetical protein
MTQDEIIEMARQASGGARVPDILIPVFERFAKAVSQHEREACVKECDACICTAQASEAIRSRGQA